VVEESVGKKIHRESAPTSCVGPLAGPGLKLLSEKKAV
jgi:hypothetical protein